MARVVKKEKKQRKEPNKKVTIITSSIIGAITVVGLIIGLVIYFAVTAVPELYSNSRSIDYDTLQELQSDSSERAKYEKTIYVLVFHSDIEQYPNYELTSIANSRAKTAVTNDLKLNEYQSKNTIEMSQRTAFYTLDLMDDDNDGILEDDVFGLDTSKPYIITITNTSSGITVKIETSTVSSQLVEINNSIETLLTRYE